MHTDNPNSGDIILGKFSFGQPAWPGKLGNFGYTSKMCCTLQAACLYSDSNYGHSLYNYYKCIVVQLLYIDSESPDKSISLLSHTRSGIVKIERPVREPVTENNPIVLDLVKANYSVEQSIAAVVKCGTLDAALVYLEESVIQDENSDEEEFIPTPFKDHNSIFAEKWCIILLTVW